MSDVFKLACPTCGGSLETIALSNQFKCKSCGNAYLMEQKGKSLELIPVSAAETQIAGSNNVVVQVKNIMPASASNPPGHGEFPSSPSSQSAVEDGGECPICGRHVEKSRAFRCKHCRRPSICLIHQDSNSYLCSECSLQLRNQEIAERRNAFWSLETLQWFLLFFVIGSTIASFIGFSHYVLSSGFCLDDMMLIAPLISGVLSSIPALIVGLMLVNIKKKRVGYWGISFSAAYLFLALAEFLLMSTLFFKGCWSH